MTSKLTREQSEDTIEGLEGLISRGVQSVHLDMAIAGMRQLIAALDSEPVAEVCGDYAIRYISSGPAPKEGLHPGDKLYRHAQPVVQCPYPCGWDTLNNLAIQDAAFVARGLVEGEPVTESLRQAAISSNDRLLKVIAACRAAMLQAGNSPVIPGAEQRIADAVELLKQAAPAMLADNGGPDGPLVGRLKSPVIPDGYVMVPKEPTAEMIAAAMNCDDVEFNSDETFCVNFDNIYAAMVEAAPQPQSAPQNIPEIIPGWIPVSERMPGAQEWVIVFAKWANQQVLCWDDVQNRWTDFEDQSYYADMFTHWMPLPTAPQEPKP